MDIKEQSDSETRERPLMDVDAMLSKVGDFHRYQYKLLMLFSVINFISAYHYFAQTFISIIPPFQCTKPNSTKYIDTMACQLIEVNGSDTIRTPCHHWDYNTSYGFISIVQEFNWICDDDWKPVLGQSLYFIGSAIGSLTFGFIADSLGRLHALVLSNMVAFMGNVVTLLAGEVVLFGIGRFLAGCATDANFVMMYIIVMEYVRPSTRTLGLNLCIGVFYCISSMLVPWTAVLLGSWQYFLLFLSVPMLTVLSFYYIVPESAQWLLSKGKLDEAISCFKRIAEVNKKTLDSDTIYELRRYADLHIKSEKNNENFIGLLKTPKLRRKTFILIFKSMAMTLGYDAIARNVNGFNVSPFWIFTASSATIFPAALIILGLQDRIGRKAMASGSLLISGVFMALVGIIMAFYQETLPILTVSLIVVARLGTVVAYNSGAQYAVELIPTVVRGQGVSVIHVAGHAATFFSPQLLYLSNYWKPLPEVTLGILLIAGSCACLFLPETLNRTLPVTLEDGELFGEDQGVFEFAFSNKNIYASTTALVEN